MEESLASIGLPSGCKVFGGGSSFIRVEKWLRHWRTKKNDFSFLLVLAGSSTAEVEGISAAGATADSRRYTALADAELLLYGATGKRNFPLPRLDAGISPALISHVASQLIGVSPQIAAAGLLHQPTFPYWALEDPPQKPSACLSTGKAMALSRVKALWKKGLLLGRSLKNSLVLAECVPGGTTTAQAVLSGFNLSISDLISGSARNPPLRLKKTLVDKGLLKSGVGINSSPDKLLSAIGDPFQPFAVGLLIGAREVDQQVLLAGGSQMLAVLALALASLDPALRSDFIDGVSVGTTYWLASEKVSKTTQESSLNCITESIEEHFGVRILGVSSGLRFNSSKLRPLRDYEHGYIKEGVGAGALALLAQINGFSVAKLVEECEKLALALNEPSVQNMSNL